MNNSPSESLCAPGVLLKCWVAGHFYPSTNLWKLLMSANHSVDGKVELEERQTSLIRLVHGRACELVVNWSKVGALPSQYCLSGSHTGCLALSGQAKGTQPCSGLACGSEGAAPTVSVGIYIPPLLP